MRQCFAWLVLWGHFDIYEQHKYYDSIGLNSNFGVKTSTFVKQKYGHQLCSRLKINGTLTLILHLETFPAAFFGRQYARKSHFFVKQKSKQEKDANSNAIKHFQQFSLSASFVAVFQMKPSPPPLTHWVATWPCNWLGLPTSRQCRPLFPLFGTLIALASPPPDRVPASHCPDMHALPKRASSH